VSDGGPRVGGSADLDPVHQDVAAWVMGALDPEDRATFAIHLETCSSCREEVRVLQPVRGWLGVAAPPIELPPGLRAKTVQAVEQAVERAAALDHRRGLRVRLLAAAAAVVLIGTGAAVTAVRARDPRPSVTIALRAPGTGTAHGQAVGHDTAAGWSVALSVGGLPPLAEGEHYECWYAGADNAPGHPDLISAGSFEVGPDGSATEVQMWTVVDLKHQKGLTMLITREPDTNPALTGPLVLSGPVNA
jgi:Anti-sigma-K factor rskA/Putative zinc-finger